MEDTLVRPPRTIMEVFKMLPETTLAEVINNQLYMSPSPVGRHQRVISKLFTQIYDYVESQGLGEAFVAPFDVFLDEESNAVQPDIFFISANRLDMVDDDGGVHGVPDLIIEVLSPGNPQHDRITKKALYQNFKVKEYWVIDPTSRKAKGYKFVKGLYQALPDVTGKIASPLLKETFKF
jgi:Uma2 family endonuclease